MSDSATAPLESEVLDWIDRRGEELVQLLRDLVAIPTPNPPGDNYSAFCDFVANWLTEAGLEVEVVTPPLKALPRLLRSGAEGQRYAVQGSLKGAADHPAFCLQGHYDTVPPSDDWDSDPYDPQLVDGKLYGLGATDMKGGLASMMMAAKALAQSDVAPRGGLHVLATPDEELQTGAGLAYFLEEGMVDADYAVVGEGTGVHRINIGMKGGVWGDVTIRGQACHGSRPSAGLNAFEKMVGVASVVRSTLVPRLAQRVSRYDFDPPDCNQATLMLGGMVGGTNASRATVPDKCTVSFDRRIIPEERLEEVEEEFLSFFDDLRQQDEELSLEVRFSFKASPMVVPADAEICRVLSDATAEVTGVSPSRTVSCGGGDSALFVDRGVQAVTYGPGVEGCAHAAGEHVRVADLAVAAKVYAVTALQLLV